MRIIRELRYIPTRYVKSVKRNYTAYIPIRKTEFTLKWIYEAREGKFLGHNPNGFIQWGVGVGSNREMGARNKGRQTNEAL